jgi:hypothetical protein
MIIHALTGLAVPNGAIAEPPLNIAELGAKPIALSLSPQMQNVVLLQQQNAPIHNAVPSGDGVVIPATIAVLAVNPDLETAVLIPACQFPQTLNAVLV